MNSRESDNLIEMKELIKSENISIAWKNLSYSVDEWVNWKWRKKTILRCLTGHFTEGTLNGLIGSSGSGKTTFLSCLSGNSKFSNQNQIYINPNLKPVTSFFIPQNINQCMLGDLPVGQILNYAFAFKNGPSTLNQIEQHIKETMTTLMLPQELLSRPFSQCSGGEQKRVAIAQELMAQDAPNFLLVDELTTGLDTATAYELVSCLQKLAKTQKITVIAVIHAPSSDTLDFFDKLYVLANGVAVFSGPPSEVKLRLENDISVNVSDEQPPLEALIQISSNHTDTSDIIKLATLTQNSEHKFLSENVLSTLELLSNGLNNNFKPFSFFSLLSLTSRQFYSTFISKHRFFFAQVLIHILNVIFLSTLFNNDMVLPSGCYPISSKTTKISCQKMLEDNAKLHENINFLVFTEAIEGFVITCSSSLLFVLTVNILQHEFRNKMYSLTSFYCSVSIISTLELLVYVLCISTTAYLATEQFAVDDYFLNWNRFAQFSLSILLLGLYTQSLGQLVGVLCMHSSVLAVVVAVMVYMTMDIMNDFLFKTDEFKISFMVTASNVVGLKYVTKYMIYVFYGIDRCKEDTEFSAVLVKHFVKEEDVGFYIRRLLENVVAMKVATFVALYFKFYSFNFATKYFKLKSKSNSDELQQIKFNSADVVEVTANQNEFSTTAVVDKAKNEMIIGWRNLSVEMTEKLSLKRQKKVILQQLNGEFVSGTCNAIMGPSGSGKTTLLKVLNGQLESHLIPESRFYLSKGISSCFIKEDVSSHLMPGLTAKQMMMFASRLKNVGKNVNHKKVVQKWLQELNLLNITDTKVENCSDGERKRLAVALELTALKMPNLICIDEPTSGLDSNSAAIVIKTLSSLTQSHKICILTSIHQPTTEVLFLFDSLYMLARGGVCIFSGSPKSVQSFIAETVTVDQNKHSFLIEELIKLSCNDSKNENIKRLVEKTLTQHKELNENIDLITRIHLKNTTKFSLESTYVLTLRYFTLFYTHFWKEYLLFYIVIFSYASSLHLFWDSEIAKASGCLNIQNEYLNNSCGRSNELLQQDKDVDNSLKFIFFMNNIFLLLILLHSSLTLFKEMKYFFIEHRNGWYSNSTFYLMKSVTEILPLLPMICLYIYICDIYSPVIGTNLYGHFLTIIIISIYASCSMAHLIVLLTPDGQIAFLPLVFMIVYDCFLILSNFFVNIHRLNVIYQAVSYFSISRWAFEAVLLLIYGFGRCEEGVQVHPVLKWLQIEDDDYFSCIALLLLNCVVFRAIVFCLLLLRTKSVNIFKSN